MSWFRKEPEFAIHVLINLDQNGFWMLYSNLPQEKTMRLAQDFVEMMHNPERPPYFEIPVDTLLERWQ